MAKEKESEEHKKEEKLHEKHKKKVSKKKITLLLMGIIIGAIIGYAASMFIPSSNGTYSVTCDNAVGKKAQDYVVDNFLAIQGLDAELGAVEQVGTLCKVDLAITQEGIVLQETNIFITPEGDYIILGQVIPTTENLTQPETQTQEQEQPKKVTCDDIAKEDNPELNAFVVSYCPFGTQMQRVFAEIVKEIPELKDYMKLLYMGAVVDGKITAMHGDKEAQENLRQICIREEQSDKFWDYLGCFMKAGEVDSCLTEADINTGMLDTCMTGGKGLEYAQEDFDLQGDYSITGSPTLILNGVRVSEFDFGGRTAEAVKTLLCCGFNDEPGVCSKELTTDQAATSFSETYSTNSASSGGSC